jgi:hypothetical protein
MPKVYSFKVYDPAEDVFKLSGFKAPIELIEQEKGIALLATEEDVESYFVKENGQYRLVE